jgi:propanol-preferring alcohol dehydrogenase
VKAFRLHHWNEGLTLEEVSRPSPGEAEVLLEVIACGVGQTVLNCIRGDLGRDPANLPRTPGHELVGTVVEVGRGVDGGRTGETVAAYFYLFCGTCPRCLAGTEDLCEKLAGYLGVDRDGGYAELVTIPARNAIRLPDGIDPVLATAIPDAIATPVHVARRALIRPRDRVAVVGAAGGVGIHMVQVAQAYGADVAGLDVGSDKLARLESTLGVAAVDSSDFSRIRLPWSGTPGPDVVIDFLGSPASLGWALGALGNAGRLVVLTTFREVEVPVSPRQLVLRELSVLGSRYATRYEVDLAARLVLTGRVKPIVGRRESPDSVEAIHDDLRTGRLLGRGALVW